MKRESLILDDKDFAELLRYRGHGRELGELQWGLILSGYGGKEFPALVCWREAIRRLRLKYERESR